jgi:ornithine cyclodeaminase/alanine dehydrogenase-like protein (mu-crystallin family)
MRAVRDLREVIVVSRSRQRADALVREAGGGARVGVPSDVADADLVCTCTTSSEPVLEGARLAPGTHVNAVGAYTPRMREIDAEGVRRSKVVVETREAAMAEAGDLLLAIDEGVIGPDHVVADLAEVVKGRAVRTEPEDVTLFESVGIAFEDLIVASAVAERR